MIRATHLAADRLAACGLVARSACDLARLLLAAGHDPAAPLATFLANGTPSLRFASLAHAAALTVADDRFGRPAFRRWRGPETRPPGGGAASPVSENRPAGTAAPIMEPSA